MGEERGVTDMDMQTNSQYFIDQEDMQEMVRLSQQGRFLTKAMGTLFVDPAMTSAHDVLDIACGPGEWVLAVANRYPAMHVTGIDSSKRMMQYATMQAQAQHTPITFLEADIRQSLPFAEASFDVVNARLLFGFMTPALWPSLLAECFRVLRPGGWLQCTEYEDSPTTGATLEHLGSLFAQALKQAGRSFSPGGRTLGLTPVLGRLLREAGFRQVRHHAHALEYSRPTDAWEGFYTDFRLGHKLLHPFLIGAGLVTQEEIERLYEQALHEMREPDFCGVWYFDTILGQKPYHP